LRQGYYMIHTINDYSKLSPNHLDNTIVNTNIILHIQQFDGLRGKMLYCKELNYNKQIIFQ